MEYQLAQTNVPSVVSQIDKLQISSHFRDTLIYITFWRLYADYHYLLNSDSNMIQNIQRMSISSSSFPWSHLVPARLLTLI